VRKFWGYVSENLASDLHLKLSYLRAYSILYLTVWLLPEYVVAVSGFSLFFTVSETNSTKTSQNVSNSKVWTCLFYSGRVDYITIEILKADIETTTKHLEKLVNNMWEKEVVSSDWTEQRINSQNTNERRQSSVW
jgi:hypothetical protein